MTFNNSEVYSNLDSLMKTNQMQNGNYTQERFFPQGNSGGNHP